MKKWFAISIKMISISAFTRCDGSTECGATKSQNIHHSAVLFAQVSHVFALGERGYYRNEIFTKSRGDVGAKDIDPAVSDGSDEVSEHGILFEDPTAP